MTFEEKAKDDWFDNEDSTADDLIKTAIDEGYTKEEAEKVLKGSKWAQRNSDHYKRAWKQYDNLTASEKSALEEKRSVRQQQKARELAKKNNPLVQKAEAVNKGKDAQLPLFPKEKIQALEEAKRKNRSTLKSPTEVAQEVSEIISGAAPQEQAEEQTVEEQTEEQITEPEEEKPEVTEMKGTLTGVDLSDGLSMSEAEQIANAYADTSSNVKADMYLNYLRNNLKLSDDQVKKIVNATRADSSLRKEFYEGNQTVDNVGGTTGTEMRRQKEASEALKKDFLSAYDDYKKGAETAGEDVAKSKVYEKERNPRGVLSALKNGEFGDISKDADPEERKQAFQTAIYLGGDVVATALRNVGATFKGGQPTGESMWTQRQKEKFAAATANVNKALDAGTETEIGGKQRSLEFSQNVQKAIDDGRVQKMLDSLGEDIKADDVMRDIAKYESVANTFKSKTLEDKANILLGMEMDGKQLSQQAIVALLASLNETEYKELGQKVAELAKGVGAGIGEALKGLFPSFFRGGSVAGTAAEIAGDLSRGDVGGAVQHLGDKLTNLEARQARNQAEADEKASNINAIIKTKFPELNFVGTNDGSVHLQGNDAARNLAKELDMYSKIYDTTASNRLTQHLYDEFGFDDSPVSSRSEANRKITNMNNTIKEKYPGLKFVYKDNRIKLYGDEAARNLAKDLGYLTEVYDISTSERLTRYVFDQFRGGE